VTAGSQFSMRSPLQEAANTGATGNDTGLMFRLRNDDASALDELMSRYWSSLVNYVAHMMKDRDAAYDIAQEAFVRLWQRRQQWDPRGSVAVWLFRTARNLVITEQRRRQVRARWLATFDGSDRAAHTPARETESQELDAAIEAALRQLSPRRREAFTLFYLRDFSYRDIADIMGIRPQSVANHLHSALAELRVALTPFCADLAGRP
jgi:RNA polymerase sigma factor (sigma-70 family)